MRRAGEDRTVSKHDKTAGWGDLTEAASALERELARFEELTGEARRVRLDTRKGLERAAKATTDAAASQKLVDLALGALVQAIAAVRERHEGNAAALQARGEEISARASEYTALLERFSALGAEGGELNGIVQELAGKKADSATPDGVLALVAAIEAVETRMAALMEGARGVAQDAAAAAITDLAQQADSLRQQVAAARNKLGLLRRSLAPAPPDEPLPN
jgi:hypothetical protein